MANFTVPNGHVGAHAKTLTATEIDTVTFELGNPNTPGWAQIPRRVEILNDGDGDIYATTDGSDPTAAGSHCWRVKPGSVILDVRDANEFDQVVIKLISAGTPTYSVSRAA